MRFIVLGYIRMNVLSVVHDDAVSPEYALDFRAVVLVREPNRDGQRPAPTASPILSPRALWIAIDRLNSESGSYFRSESFHFAELLKPFTPFGNEYQFTLSADFRPQLIGTCLRPIASPPPCPPRAV